ncbi:MAG TPA: cadherin-like beta sandwich domain-containing protein, partial [Candidatus Udaeobacter sp.]|nr:cadherin-like beta sandwich domain-containing protein [Candidatus Udaeobacter sp.]
YHFVNWSDGVTTATRTDMNVMADISVTANFAINTYTLTYTADPNGSITGTSPQTVNCGADGTAVTAVPNACYHFVNWSDGVTTATRTDMNVMADINVTANFAINTYTLTYTAGANGSITGTSPQTVNCGSDGTAVTAVPDSGYHFVNWSDASTQNPRTDMNVMADISVTANFAVNASNNADLSNLTASAGPLSPPFDANTLSYTVNVPFSTTSTTVTPTAADPNATITVNGNPVASGTPSGSIALNVGSNIITVVVTAQDTTTMKTYTINVIRGGNVVVSGSTGADGQYATLKGAFDAINANGTQGGNTIGVSIIGDTNETAPAVLNQPTVSTWTSLTVTPSGARTVTGSLAAPLVDLAGADKVTINGLNSAGNTLTLSNTNTGATGGTSTIRFINGATQNMVINCSIRGSSTGLIGAATGTILFSTSTVAGGNSSNTIQNNDIGPAGANLPSKAMMALGSASPNDNTVNLISSNNIFDFFLPTGTGGTAGISIAGNNTMWTIANNRIYQTATRTFTGAAGITYSGVTVNNSGTFMVNDNVIGFGAANGTGTTTITGTGTGLGNQFRGINFLGSNTTTFSTISGNTISGINQTTNRTSTTTDNAAFIAILSGSSATDGPANITGNTIGSLDGTSTIVINDGATGNTAPLQGILDFNFVDAVTISNNNIGSITLQGAGTTPGFRGILVAGTTGTTHAVTNNIIGGPAAGSITNSLVGSNSVYGIQGAATNVNATGNLVRNLTSNSNGAGLIVTCGIITGSTSTGVNTTSQNTVYGLLNNSGAASNAVRGIQCTFPTAANIVERNFVHSLNMTATVTTGSVDGIVHGSTGTASYRNNMVRLGLDASGASITTGIGFNGMLEQAGTNNYYFNSVYVGGSGVASAANTFAFSSAVVTNVRNYKDNIFWNARSNASGAGKNYAITVGGTAPNPAGLTSNFNDLFANGTGGFVGLFNAVDQLTLANWQTATGQDAMSISANPQFVNPTGTATVPPFSPNGAATTVDLHITCASPADAAGTPIAGVTNDFDNQTRDAINPDIGADEINLVAPTLVSAVSRKVHGAAGPFDITLPGIESRSGGATNAYQMVFTFAAPVNVGSATITSGTGVIAMASGNGTNTITVDLTGVTNAQYLTVKLLCVDDTVNLGSVSATMGVLIGDATASGAVNNTDVSQVKADVSAPVDGTNFRSDVTASGDINSSDVGLTKLKSGTALPP